MKPEELEAIKKRLEEAKINIYTRVSLEQVSALITEVETLEAAHDKLKAEFIYANKRLEQVNAKLAIAVKALMEVRDIETQVSDKHYICLQAAEEALSEIEKL